MRATLGQSVGLRRRRCADSSFTYKLAHATVKNFNEHGPESLCPRGEHRYSYAIQNSTAETAVIASKTYWYSLLFLYGCISSAAAPAVADDGSDPAKRPQILAHTMPWFEAKAVSKNWGWHWTMNRFNPDKIVAGRREIAAHYYPQIGPYDSGDPAVIEYQLLTMKLAGIDGVIVPWSGLTDLYDYAVNHRHTQALHDQAAKLGMSFAICYEDQTIPKLVSAGRLKEEDRVPHARHEIEWMQKNWFATPSYLKFGGRPVLLSFGQSGLTDAEWTEVLGSLKEPPVYVSLHHRRTAAAGAFDWPLPKEGLEAVDRFDAESKAKAWRCTIPVAFPRFHDIYDEAKVHESWGRIDDDRGRTFATTLERALRSGAPFVQIATWNDWGEGTIIEPSLEFGDRDLKMIQKPRRFVDKTFAATPDDLVLPKRLLALRRTEPARRDHTPELDRAALMLASGETAEAKDVIRRLEADGRYTGQRGNNERK
jgi:hypothetical protein